MQKHMQDAMSFFYHCGGFDGFFYTFRLCDKFFITEPFLLIVIFKNSGIIKSYQ